MRTAFVALLITLGGCALFTPQNIKYALGVEQVACIIAHAELPDANVALVCNVTDTLLHDMQQILSETRASNARARAKK